MTELHHALKAPCKSCPYRKDVPSGVWAPEEYAKLPNYDGEIIAQVHKEAFQLFLCHQQNNALCSGWLGCHGPQNLLAMRLHHGHVEPEAFQYETDVPLFKSGAAAAFHGLLEVEAPGEKAKKTMTTLVRKRERMKKSR